MANDVPTNGEPPTGVRPPHTEPQLAEIVALVGEVLGPGLVGMYLHGSAALGGLRPQSDLDILVVSSRPTTRDDKRLLVERLLTVSSVERFLTASRPIPPGLPRPIELTIVVQSEVRPWRYPPRFDFQYGDWWRREFESGDVEPWPTTTNPDLASLLTMALLADWPVLGPPPAEVLDPVPHADYLRAIVGDLDTLLDHLAGDTANALLTLARIWSTLATGYIRPKDTAAAWALAHLPHGQRLVLARARAGYLGEEEERWDDVAPRIRPCADYMIDEIMRRAADESATDPAESVKLLPQPGAPNG